MRKCTAVSDVWQQYENHTDQYDHIFADAGFGTYTISSVVFILSLVNTVICFSFYNQGDYKAKAIPIVLRMKSIVGFLTIAFFVPVQLSALSRSLHKPVIKVYPICAISMFIHQYFSFSYNWAKVLVNLYRCIRTMLPTQTFTYFQMKKAGYFAVTLVETLSFVINVNSLIIPAVASCQFHGETYCAVQSSYSAESWLRAYLVIGHIIPYIACLFVLCFLKLVKNTIINRDRRCCIDPAFYRAYTFMFASTVTFLASNMPWVAYAIIVHFTTLPTMSDKAMLPLLTIGFVVVTIRHIGFTIDWLIYMGISSAFRNQVRQYLQSKWRTIRQTCTCT